MNNEQDRASDKTPAQWAKPEPIVTEDHLRRACDELNVERSGLFYAYPSDVEITAVLTVARLLAERDAMQARVEGEPVAEVISYRQMECEATIRFTPTLNGGVPFDIGTQLYTTKSEPTPDPDLVLAREAAAKWYEGELKPETAAATRRGGRDMDRAVQSALHALKLKGQAHDQ